MWTAAGAKLLLVGDHRQLAAVGAGGGMDLLAAAGNRYELDRGPPLHPRVGARRVAAAARRRRGPCCATTTSTAGSSTPAPASRPRPSAARAWLGRHPRRTRVAAARRHQRASRPPVRAAARRARPARPGRRGRRAARLAGHRRRGRRPRPGPLQRLGPRRARRQPARPDQPRDLPGHRHPRRRRPRRRPRPRHRTRRADAGGADGAARAPTSPSTSRWPTPPPCTPRRAGPSTPATP